MTSLSTIQDAESEEKRRQGKDEMNLAEFPFARLGRKDTRMSIEYQGQTVAKSGEVHLQRWIVSGSAPFGLPTEFAERVLVALISLTAAEKFANRKVTFTIYQILQMLGMDTGQRNYKAVKKALKQLVGVTIYSEGAYFDKASKQRITTEQAFHLIDKIWLKSWGSQNSAAEEGCTGYMIWGEPIWLNFQAGYIKNLDVAFYYSLENALARRLYRFLDKRMYYQESYEIDIFDLAARLGLRRYHYPSKVQEKLHPGMTELIERGFLVSAEMVKVGKYTRLRFIKAVARPTEPQETDTEAHTAPEIGLKYISTEQEELHSLTDEKMPLAALSETERIWQQVLDDLRLALPAHGFTMLEQSVLEEIDDGRAVVAVDAQSKDWIERQLMRKLKQALQMHAEQPVREITFTSLP